MFILLFLIAKIVCFLPFLKIFSVEVDVYLLQNIYTNLSSSFYMSAPFAVFSSSLPFLYFFSVPIYSSFSQLDIRFETDSVKNYSRCWVISSIYFSFSSFMWPSLLCFIFCSCYVCLSFYFPLLQSVFILFYF